MLNDLCLSTAQRSRIPSLTIIVSGRLNAQGEVAHSDGVAMDLHAIEFALGEGPTTDALKLSEPTLACDLQLALDRWPQFASAALRLNVRAISAIPLRVGAIRLGSLTFYAREAKTVGELAGMDAFAVANDVVSILLNDTDGLQLEAEAHSENPAGYRAVVHQAAGMVAVQLGCDVADALVRLRATAFAEGKTVEEIARSVVDRTRKLVP